MNNMARSIALLSVFALCVLFTGPMAWAQLTPGNLVVLQIGDGAAALTNASTAISLIEFTTAGSPVQTITIPSTGTPRLTLTGTSTSEGHLIRSSDGQFLTIVGYDTVAGAPAGFAVANKEIARIDALGAINYTTKFTDGAAGAVRSAVSSDGTTTWTTSSTIGVRYTPFGSSGTSIQMSTTPTNTRVVKIFNGQLYMTSGSGGFTSVCTIGTGIPTTSGQTTTPLPGMVTSARSPYSFSISPDGNTIYLADDGAVASNGGIQKWTLSAGTWSNPYTLLNNGVTTTGARGLTVDWSGADPVIYATTAIVANGSPNLLIKVIDTGSGSTATTLATCATNTQFRGVDFAPTSSFSEPTTQASNITFSSVASLSMTVNWTNGNGTSRLVVAKAGGAVDSNPVDLTAYTANSAFGTGSQLGTGNYVVYSGTGNSVSVTNMTPSTTYHFRVYEYNGLGSSANYNTATATGNPNSQTTLASSASSSSDIVAVTASESNTISSLVNDPPPLTSSTGVQVWQVTIRDGGGASDGDALPTIVTGMTLTQGGSNTATNWSNTILAADLFDGTTRLAGATVNPTSMVFSGLTAQAPDNGNTTLSLRLSLKDTLITDNQIFQFAISPANVTTQPEATSSQMTPFATINSDGTKNKIDVVATKLVFALQPPATVAQNTNFSARVGARDANDNFDVDYATSFALSLATGTGVLSSVAGLTQTPTNGTFLWTDLQYNTVETGVSILAQSGSLMSATSNTFAVVTNTVTSVASGDWSSPGTWDSGVPLASQSAIISTGHAVTLSASVPAGNVTVNAGAVLDASTFTLTVSGTFTLLGTAEFKQGGSVQAVPGTIRIFASTSTYRFNGTQVGTGTGSYPEFGNLIWEPTPTGGGTLQNSTATPPFNNGQVVRGNMTINLGAAQEIRFATGSTVSRAHTIDGDLIIQGSSIVVGNNGGSAVTSTVTVGGNITLTSGTLRGVNSVGPVTFNVRGNLTNNGIWEHGFGTGVVTFNLNGITQQSISGTNGLMFESLTVNNVAGVVQSTNDTIKTGGALTLANGILSIPSLSNKIVLNGSLVESPGRTVVGAVEASRTVASATNEAFGGIGIELNALASAPGPTLVRRVTGVASSGGSNTSILRYFDITPDTNSGLNATLRYFYDNTELAGQNPSTLQLWKSTDIGLTWTAQGGAVDTSLHRVEVTGIDGLSRWTASDAAHPLTGGGAVTLGVSVAQNWNIVSLPVSAPVPDDSVKHLYTNSVNNYAFDFSLPGPAYHQQYRMANGPGYWIKSSITYTQNITGTQRDTLTVPVSTNWNMIGSISTSIDTSAAHVTPTPVNLRGSNYFKYLNGYVVVTTIEPGLGYWVKANSAGSFFMHATGPAGKVSGEEAVTSTERSIEELNTLTIRDANGGSQTLYFGADANGEIPVSMFAMPPAPPEGSFDARFESSEGGLMVQTHAEQIENVIDLPITIQSAAYPLMVSWKVNGTASSYELSDGSTTHPMRGEGTLRIANSAVQQLVLKVMGEGGVPKEFALSQNYPNPFNPTTSIKYALPVDSRVTMDLYNIIGQRVRTLVNDNVAAGYHLAEWDGTGNAGQQLASGVYFLQMSAKGTNGKTFNEVRKLIMLK